MDAAADAHIERLFAYWRAARDAYENACNRLDDAIEAEALARGAAAAKALAASHRAVADDEAGEAYKIVSPLVEELSAATPSTPVGALLILEMLAVEFDGFQVPNLPRIVTNLRPALSAA